MMRPPLYMNVKVKNPQMKHGIWIPIPIILILLIVLILMIALAPLALLVALILLPFGMARTILLLAPVLLSILFALRGLEIDVDTGKNERVLVVVK